MILGVLLFLAGNASVSWCALALVRKVWKGPAPQAVVLILIMRLLLISLLVILAGMTQMLTKWGLGLACTALTGVVLCCRVDRSLPRIDGRFLRTIPGILAGVVALRLLMQVWYFSPHLGDALAYHLPKIAEWVQKGGFTLEMGVHPHASFPAGFELVEAWWVVFLHHDVLIEMAGVEFLALGVAAAWSLALSVGLPARAALLAAAIYGMCPGPHLSATSCLNDVAAGALVLSTASMILGSCSPALILLPMGLGLGVKATYLYALPGLLLLGFFARDELRRSAPAGRIGIVLAAAALLAGGFWFGRNWVAFGNPIHPVGSPGYSNLPVAVQVGPNLSSLWANSADLVNTRLYDDQAPMGANVDDMAGWGPVVFACGPLSLLLGIWHDVRVRRLAFSFLLSLAASFLLSIHDPWCMKYVFYFPCVPAIAVAWLVERLPELKKVVLAGLAYSFAATMLPYDLSAEYFRSLVRQSWIERSGFPLTEPPVSSDVVGCFGSYAVNAYLLYRPDFSRRVVYLRPSSPEEFVESAKRAGLTVLYAAPGTPEQAELFRECIRRGALRGLEGHFWIVE